MQNIEDYFKDSFVFGFGIEQLELVLQFANNSRGVTFKLWIGNGIVSDLSKEFENLPLDEDEKSLLALGRLMYANVTGVFRSEDGGLTIQFERQPELKVHGHISGEDNPEPWRICQMTPDTRYLTSGG
ncbi:hypothetical protein [Flaviaesturariibacter amylovorans]|uniref:Uncharacterized protein n=1 Tax=Flaviaesturariibacter amylovorans TaxID=1084520 RepID=A0ABP8HMU9_9BACT